jgi:hemoglobin-like flavoprotein
VQSTFAMVAPIADQAAVIFYDRLFDLNPALRDLFAADMTDQRRKLMQMLSMVVHGLNRFDAMKPAVEDLGRRHVDYRISAGDYDTVGAALLWTLEQGLGEAFTPEARDAWTAAYAALAGTMKGASAWRSGHPVVEAATSIN